MAQEILVVGGYGAVGRRIARLLDAAHPGSVIVAGRNPERVLDGPARRIDVDDAASIDAALAGIAVVVACVRQREPHLLQAAVRRGIAYTSIAPPWIPWPELEPLHVRAQQTGARIIAAAGLEPGISSVLARVAAERLGTVDTIETALLLGVGDAYGADSMVFLLAELAERYHVLVDGRSLPARAFGANKRVVFPEPIGERLAYTIPFRDQLYYPHTLGARTSIARIVPLPRRNRVRAQVREAEAMTAMARADLAAMQRMIEGEAASARALVLAADARVAALRDEVVPRSRQAIGPSLAGYAAGQLPLVSVVEAARALWAVEGELITAQMQLGVAWARLRRATGGAVRP